MVDKTENILTERLENHFFEHKNCGLLNGKLFNYLPYYQATIPTRILYRTHGLITAVIN